MTTDTFGQLCALLAAVTWAMALVLFKQSGEHVPPIALNLFKNCVAIVLFGVTLAVLPSLIRAGAVSEDETIRPLAWMETWKLIVSGVIGIAVADTLVFYSLNRIGVGIMVVVDCIYAPSMIFFAWLMEGERLMPLHYVGAALIVAGVFISTRHKPPADRTRRQMIMGILAGMLAIVSMAWAIIYAMPVVDEHPVIWTTMVRMVAGTVSLGIFAALSRDRFATLMTFKPARIWRKSIPAAFFGTYLAVLFWIAGFKFTTASVAAVLNQTSIVFAVVLAAVFLQERFNKRKITSVVLAACGVVVVRLEPVLREWYDAILVAFA